MRDAVVASAVARGRSSVHAVSLAGHDVRFTIDERIASAVLPAFSHLPKASGAAALCVRVNVLEGELRRALELETLGLGGALDHLDGGATVLHRQPHAATVLDRDAATVHAVVHEGGHDAATDAKPLQLPLSIFFAERDVDFVHGGLVALRGEGVLLAGRSGSGKSTVAFASMLAGLDFLGDDCVAVTYAPDCIAGHRIFADGCLEYSHVERLPALRVRAARRDGKAVVEAVGLTGATTPSSACIRGVIVPRITGSSDVSMVPIRPAEALMALAPSSIVKRAVPGAAVLSRLSRLVQRVPCYRLEMGPVERVGAEVRTFLEALS